MKVRNSEFPIANLEFFLSKRILLLKKVETVLYLSMKKKTITVQIQNQNLYCLYREV